jgi:hypothetical protein
MNLQEAREVIQRTQKKIFKRLGLTNVEIVFPALLPDQLDTQVSMSYLDMLYNPERDVYERVISSDRVKYDYSWTMFTLCEFSSDVDKEKGLSEALVREVMIQDKKDIREAKNKGA